MMTIPAVTRADGVVIPAQAFPEDALVILCNGTEYAVYQSGDELPEPPTPTNDNSNDPNV